MLYNRHIFNINFESFARFVPKKMTYCTLEAKGAQRHSSGEPGQGVVVDPGM